MGDPSSDPSASSLSFCFFGSHIFSNCKMRGVGEMGLKDLAAERPEFTSWLGHMLVTWQEDPQN